MNDDMTNFGGSDDELADDQQGSDLDDFMASDPDQQQCPEGYHWDSDQNRCVPD